MSLFVTKYSSEYLMFCYNCILLISEQPGLCLLLSSRMSGNGKDDQVTSPTQSRPGSVMQEENNDGAGAVGGAAAGGGGDYSGVAQRTVANIRRLQDNMCSQYVQSRQGSGDRVQSRHVSSSSSHVSQYELENCCLQSDGDTPQQPPDNQELVTLSPLRVNLPSPPPSPKPVSDEQEQQSPHLSTQDPNWQSNKE